MISSATSYKVFTFTTPIIEESAAITFILNLSFHLCLLSTPFSEPELEVMGGSSVPFSDKHKMYDLIENQGKFVCSNGRPMLGASRFKFITTTLPPPNKKEKRLHHNNHLLGNAKRIYTPWDICTNFRRRTSFS